MLTVLRCGGFAGDIRIPSRRITLQINAVSIRASEGNTLIFFLLVLQSFFFFLMFSLYIYMER